MENLPEIQVSSSYLGPVSYYSRFLMPGRVIIEQFDHYVKQTYRNRCMILSANGPMALVIPVVKNHGRKTLMKDVRIDYATNWQRLHLNGIISGYRSSAFFEFYFDDFEPFLRKKTTFLLDLNTGLTDLILENLGLAKNYEFSREFNRYPASSPDYRDLIHPKKRGTEDHFRPVPYFQVFSDRFGFVPDLSIIDLLFNTGPEAGTLLEASLNS